MRLSEKAGETQREEQKQSQQRREAKERRKRVEKDDFDPWADEELKQLSADEAYLSCEYAVTTQYMLCTSKRS